MTLFRRAFIDHGHVCVETKPEECWYLPNPTPGGQRYDPARMLQQVVFAGTVNIKHWKRMD